MRDCNSGHGSLDTLHLIKRKTGLHPNRVQNNPHKFEGGTGPLSLVHGNRNAKILKSKQHARQALLAALAGYRWGGGRLNN